MIGEPQKIQLQEIHDKLYYHIKNQDYITHEVVAEQFHQFCREQCHNKYINHMIEPMRLLQRRVFNRYYQVGIQAFKAMEFTRCELINAIIAHDIPLIEKHTSKIFDETENAYRKIYTTFL